MCITKFQNSLPALIAQKSSLYICVPWYLNAPFSNINKVLVGSNACEKEQFDNALLKL